MNGLLSDTRPVDGKQHQVWVTSISKSDTSSNHVQSRQDKTVSTYSIGSDSHFLNTYIKRLFFNEDGSYLRYVLGTPRRKSKMFNMLSDTKDSTVELS